MSDAASLMEGVMSTLWVAVDQMGLERKGFAIELGLRLLVKSNLRQTRVMNAQCIAFTWSPEVRMNEATSSSG